MLRRILGCLVVALLFAPVSEAQILKKLRDKLDDLGAAPEIQVTLHHPPRLGLEVSRVAFGPEEGDCAADFVDALLSVFTESGVEVVNRRQIEELLKEHEFSLSGIVNRDDAIELGEILGPTALVFVSVRRCATEPQMTTRTLGKYDDGSTAYEHIARRTGYFRASVQVVDLATGRIDRARTVNSTKWDENKSRDGKPALPSEFQVIDRTIRGAVSDVHKWFFPWTEHRTLKFFDNNDCNLKLAYNLIRGGDYLGAREQSEENVRACEVYREEKPKLFARAVYNLGMSEFLLNNYDAALEAFNQSLRIEDLDPTPQAIADCRRAKASAMELQEDAGEEAAPFATASEDRAQVATSGASGLTERGNSTSRPDEKSLEERLEELKELHRKGLISDEVFRKKQAELLENL